MPIALTFGKDLGLIKDLSDKSGISRLKCCASTPKHYIVEKEDAQYPPNSSNSLMGICVTHESLVESIKETIFSLILVASGLSR